MADTAGVKKNNILLIAGLCAVLAAAFWARLQGITFGFPLITHPDEPEVMRPALNILRTGDLNPHTFLYPSLYIYMESLVCGIVYAFGKIAGSYKTLSDVGVTTFFYWARMLTIVLSVGTVYLTYVTGRILFDKAAAFVATIFIAGSYLHFNNSFVVTVDSPMAFWVTASFLMSVLLFVNGRKRLYYVLNGVFIGFAVGTKYTAIWCVLPMLWAHLHAAGYSARKIPGKDLLIGLFLIPAAFILSTPFVLIDFKKFIYFIDYQKKAYTLGHPGHESAFVSYGFYWRALLNKFGNVGLWLGGIGVVILTVKNFRKAVLLMIFPAVYFLFFGSYKVQFDRNMVCVVPFLSLAAGYGVVMIIRQISRIRGEETPQRIARGILCFALVFTVYHGVKKQVVPMMKKIRVLTLPDTRWQSKLWIEKNLPAGSRIGREHYTPPVDPARFKVAYLGYFGLLKARISDFDYIIASSTDYGRFVQNKKKYPAEAARYEEIFTKYPLVKEFKFDNKTITGPVIRIYKVR
ncbi:MAG: glycosyltransferase family 39 protein [Candidatus Omnitrophota bacterium]